ncbi:MAG: tyrosine--tRNA ligase [Planctomycetota bacterium]
MPTSPDLLDDLLWRGLLADCTDQDGLRARLASGPIALYCGFDPTADSLHVGHLMGQLTLRRFQRAGHRAIALAGGATGMVGDPSGRSAERNLLTRDALTHNITSIKKQLARLLDFDGSNPAELVDNAEWTAPMPVLDFLREVGKHFSLATMLAKESVKTRLEGESGISFTEFSYQLLQANDFLHLHQTRRCELQIGGSDQWGNITAGIDLIKRKLGNDRKVFGWTFPLITKSDGSKFGKTAEGAVWLDPAKTSPYRFYQFFVNTEDARVGEYLRKFTFLERAEIEQLEAAHARAPGAREAQKKLASEVTRLVHGEGALAGAQRASAILFGMRPQDADLATIREVMAEIPRVQLTPAELGEGLPLIEALVRSGLERSKSSARRAIEDGSIASNNEICDPHDLTRSIKLTEFLHGRYLLLRKGKKSYAGIELVSG